ncbi:MAG: hypothetical protein ACRCYE_00540 [Sarcina sp.]
MGNGKKLRAIILFLADIVAIFGVYLFSFFVKYGDGDLISYIEGFSKNIYIIIILYILPMIFLKMYRSLWREAGFEEFLRIGIAVIIGLFLNISYSLIFEIKIPFIITFLAGCLIFMVFSGMRLSYRIVRRLSLYGYIFN